MYLASTRSSRSSSTLWLLLRKSPVILLHWYHHVTVLLYCWHAYSVRIGTGCLVRRDELQSTRSCTFTLA